MLTPYYENAAGKLFLGDCLTVMQELIAEGVKVDAVVTDPPYSSGGQYRGDRANENYKIRLTGKPTEVCGEGNKFM